MNIHGIYGMGTLIGMVHLSKNKLVSLRYNYRSSGFSVLTFGFDKEIDIFDGGLLHKGIKRR